MSTPARAEIVARLAHRGQVDKAGVDYAEHCKAVGDIAVELSRETHPAWQSSVVRMVAWLHDTLEDTPLSIQDLYELGFRGNVLEAIKLLTHTHEHSHADYVRKIRDAQGASGELARVVKRADLIHNSSPDRAIPGMSAEKLQRRYEKAMAILEGRDS